MDADDMTGEYNYQLLHATTPGNDCVYYTCSVKFRVR